MSSPSFSLIKIDVGDISKPANTLIKSISRAIGGLYEPTRIVRLAKANAKSKLVETNGEIAVSELQQRAARRLLQQEALYQQNSEKIISDALPHLEDDAKPEEVSDDWYINFFDKACLVSDDQMQTLWSKILAGEANVPGSFSRRTVNCVESFDKQEADLFTSLCGFNFWFSKFYPLVFDERQQIYTEKGVNYEKLTLLDSIGLIKFSNLAKLKVTVSQTRGAAAYYNKSWILEFGDVGGTELYVGKVMLTKIGQELAPICGSKPVSGFEDYVMEQWKKHSPKLIS